MEGKKQLEKCRSKEGAKLNEFLPVFWESFLEIFYS